MLKTIEGSQDYLTPLIKKFLYKFRYCKLKTRFKDWNLIKAQALITVKVNYIDDKLRVEFRFLDMIAKEMMALALLQSLIIGEE